MMKKNTPLLFGFTLLLTAAALTGCKSSRGLNPAGVYGEGVFGDEVFGMEGAIPVSDRFTGGKEHPDMFEPAYFGYDSSQLGASERPKVEAVAQHLKQNPDVAVIIEGHCDERGSNEYNLALGERRALAARSYLASLGISSDRIQTKSYGEEKPADSGHDEAAWSANRRAEFVLYY
jgi:peptidoglycan-associated lipoprotein